MGTQFLEDYSLYGIGGEGHMLNGLWVALNGHIVADPDPSGSGLPVFRCTPNIVDSSIITRRVLNSGQTIVGVAGRYWLSALPSSTGYRPWFASFRNSANTVQCYITCDPSGYLESYNKNGTLIGRSDGPVLTANAWKHIETKVLFDAVAGSVEVRIEGSTKLLATGVATAPLGDQCINVGHGVYGTGGINFDLYVKDTAVWDGSGVFNADFWGACSIAREDPDADIAFPWTASSGATGYNLLDNRPPLDDLAYIEADYPPPAASKFSLSDLPADAVVAIAVQAVTRARKTDGGAANLDVGIVSGASTAHSGDIPVSTAWTYYAGPTLDADPATGDVWTVDAVNALDIQLDRTV